MQSARNRIAGIVLMVLIAGIIAAIPWLRRLSQDPGPRIVEIAGRDEIEQIVGPQAVTGAGSGVVSGSGENGAADAIPAFRGQVIRPNGEPAGGARIRATCTEDGGLAETVADAGGLFELPVDDCLFVLEASREGFGPAIVAGVRPGPSRIRLVLVAGREILGMLTFGEVPAAGATVHLGGPGLWPQRVVDADATGMYRLAGVKPGRYDLVVVGRGAGSGFSIPVVIDDPNPSVPVRVDVALRAAPEVEIDVLDRVTGTPIDFGILTIADGPLHVLSINEEVAGGPVIVDYLPADDYFLRIRAPGYLPWEGALRITDRPETIRVELSRGAIVRGVVVEEAGNPVPGARLTAYVETEAGGRWEMRRNLFDDFHRLVRPNGTPFWTLETGFVTDEEGRFELTGLPPGRAVLTANRGGYAAVSTAPIVVQRDGDYNDLRLVLTAGRSIRGRVEDAGGGAVREAWVSARSQNTPDWAIADAVMTDSLGMFVISDAGAAVHLTVRHAEFSPAAIDFDVPPEGLDNLIIRLAGEQLPQLRGRVFTAQGQPAFGARVWVMSGQSEIPACRGTVAFDGWFTAADCSAVPERILIAHPEHATLVADLGGALEPRDWTLGPGGELEVVTQRQPMLVRIEQVVPLPAGIWSPANFEIERWSRQRVQRLSAGAYRVICQAEGYEDAVVDVLVADGTRVEAVCPYMFQRTTMELLVVDHMGAPVANALVLIDGDGPEVREQSDPSGAVRWQAEPGRWLEAEALHEHWGRGTLSFFVPHAPPAAPPRIALSEPIAGSDVAAFRQTLADWGVTAVADGRAIIVDRTIAGTPAGNVGLRRGDMVLWARTLTDFRFSIGVRRAGELMTFELLRDQPTEAP